jgi:hypothetical protein
MSLQAARHLTISDRAFPIVYSIEMGSLLLSLPETNLSSPHIDAIVDHLAPWRHALLSHPVYARIDGIESLRHFMELHVFAGWDFMSLLKALQRGLCCVEVPWTPPANPAACRLVNQIVLGEESDIDEDGTACSHFDLYRRAMRRCGADTRPIDRFIDEIRSGRNLQSAIDAASLPDPVRRFVGQTFEVIDRADLCAIAAAFTFGREGLLPDMFRRLVRELGSGTGGALDAFRYYLDRHIEVDEGDHGPMALRLVADLCGDEPEHWRSAENAAVGSLVARLSLWDSIHSRLARPDAEPDSTHRRSGVTL